MDLGFEAAGFRHVAAFEINELFCKTLRRNRPSWNIFGPPLHSGDISKFEEIADALTPLVQAPFDGVFIGGPHANHFRLRLINAFQNQMKASSVWDFLMRKMEIYFSIILI